MTLVTPRIVNNGEFGPDLPIDPCFIRPLFDKGLFLQKNRGFFLEK